MAKILQDPPIKNTGYANERAATDFAASWTEAQWVWTVCLRLSLNGVATELFV